jgi:hypothetical protein
MVLTGFTHKARELYDSYGGLLLLLACALLPLKLSLTYAVLLPLITLFLASQHHRIVDIISECRSTTIPFIFFLISALFCGLFGFRPLGSGLEVLRLAFMALLTLCTFDVLRSGKTISSLNGALRQNSGICVCLLVLIGAQTIAASYSIFEAASAGQLPHLFIGAVSESGQLAIVLPLAMGLTLGSLSGSKDQSPIFIGFVLLAGALLFGFRSQILTNTGLANLALLPFLATLVLAVVKVARSTERQSHLAVLMIGLPLLSAALILNLKRGPWLGVATAFLVLLWVFKRRLIAPILTIGAIIFICFPPIQNRLAVSEEHFFIAGGRSAIWQIGADLASRYPLGIGFENSAVLRKFSDEVPPELKHFHNNALNILVETGLIGLLCFLWWITSLLRLSFKLSAKAKLIPLAVGTSILAWQTAGIVEYNFGDSEVLLIAFLAWGFLCAASNQPKVE